MTSQTPKAGCLNIKVTESASLVCACDVSDPEETWVAVEVSGWAECALHLEQLWVFHIALCIFCIFPIFLKPNFLLGCSQSTVL